MRIISCTRKEWVGVKTSVMSFCHLIKKNNPTFNVGYFDIPNNSSGLDNTVFREVRDNPPDILIAGGWDLGVRNIIQNVNRSKTKVLLNWCSPVSQIDLGGEIPQFLEVLNFLKLDFVDYVTMLLEKDAEVLSKKDKRFVHFPVCMNFDELDQNKIDKSQNEIKKCDLFCLPNHRKNILAQIVALSTMDNLEIYTNYINENYIRSAKLLLARYENLPFMDRSSYLRKIQQMDFGMQVSFSEGFNYTAAEHMYYGVPVIVSDSIPFLKGSAVLQDFVVEDPSDLNEIYLKTQKFLSVSNEELDNIKKYSSELIVQESIKNEKVLLELFKRICE